VPYLKKYNQRRLTKVVHTKELEQPPHDGLDCPMTGE
jgi:hypothetical protein